MADREELVRRQQALQAVHEEVKAQLLRIPGVVGVGIGLKETAGALTQEFAFRVYVQEKKDRAELRPEEIIPDEIMGFKTDVIKVPEATISAFVERRDRSEYRPIQGGISINAEDRGGSYGTLGWFGTLNANPATKVLLTNKHVVYDGAQGTTTDVKKVGQPNYQKICCCTCGEIGSTIIGINDTSVDCAIARLNSGVNPNLVIANVTATQQIIVGGTAAAIVGDTVRKVGARSAFTRGIVTDIAGSTITSYTDGAGNTVTITRTNELLIQAAATETYEIENGKKSFNNRGDSGSVVVNELDQIVGLIYGMSNATSATISTFTSHIASVLSALSSAGQAITLSTSPAGGGSDTDTRVRRSALTGTRLDDILERSLDRDPEEEPLVQAARAHFDELLELVNTCRPVTVVWHRTQGPAFLAALMRSVKEPAYRIPQEIEGIARHHALSAMAVVLEAHGSPALRAAIQQYGLSVMYACSRYDTVEEIVQALSQQQSIPEPEATL
jgi:hypothetical protein